MAFSLKPVRINKHASVLTRENDRLTRRTMDRVRVERRSAGADQWIDATNANTTAAFHAPERGDATRRGEKRQRLEELHGNQERRTNHRLMSVMSIVDDAGILRSERPRVKECLKV